MSAILQVTIRGRVQGVGYRAWVEEQAVACELEGWVRNRRDGSVEALATGAPQSITAFVEACRQGPRAAHVTGLDVADGEDDGSLGFSARPTE